MIWPTRSSNRSRRTSNATCWRLRRRPAAFSRPPLSRSHRQIPTVPRRATRSRSTTPCSRSGSRPRSMPPPPGRRRRRLSDRPPGSSSWQPSRAPSSDASASSSTRMASARSSGCGLRPKRAGWASDDACSPPSRMPHATPDQRSRVLTRIAPSPKRSSSTAPPATPKSPRSTTNPTRITGSRSPSPVSRRPRRDPRLPSAWDSSVSGSWEPRWPAGSWTRESG